MNRHVIGLMVMAAVVMFVGQTASAGLVFLDTIEGYDTNPPNPAYLTYEDQNPDLIRSQDNGGGRIWPGSSWSTYSLTAPDQFALISSGAFNAYTTISTTGKSSSARYGQILVRIAVKKPYWARIALFGDTSATFPTGTNVTSNAIVDMTLVTDNSIGYRDNGSFVSLPGATDAGWHEFTINYDLVGGTYDIWQDTTKIVNSSALANSGFSSVQAFAIGSAYAGSGRTLLDYWQWQDSANTAFTTYGTLVPEPGMVSLLALGGGIMALRRRR